LTDRLTCGLTQRSSTTVPLSVTDLAWSNMVAESRHSAL
jgi:hypothetical protein